MDAPTLTHLRALEAESIFILREVMAEFQRPVMLYSIGKDSSVMVRLAQKAFHPGKIPFPLLHIDTTYKFHEMIEFRDRFTRESRLAASLDHPTVVPIHEAGEQTGFRHKVTITFQATFRPREALRRLASNPC